MNPLLVEVSRLVEAGEDDAAVTAVFDEAHALIVTRRWPELDEALRRWPEGHPPAVLRALATITGLSLVAPHLPSREAFRARTGLG